MTIKSLLSNGSSTGLSVQTPLSDGTSVRLPAEELAKWNTSVRLLASLLRDHMVVATPSESPFGDGTHGLILHGSHASARTPDSPGVWIGLTQAGLLRLKPKMGLAKPLAAFPDDLAPPTAITTFGAAVGQEAPGSRSELQLNPARLLTHLRSILDIRPVHDDIFNEICNELTNSAQNGRYWIEWYKKNGKPLSFKSSMIEWERALYIGHPLHPVSYSTFNRMAHWLVRLTRSLLQDAQNLCGT